MIENRSQKAEFAAWLGIMVNIVLAILKGITGVMANSKALIADAVNSASDVAGSLAVLIGIRAAKLPPDEDHPYGHGKAEMIASIVVSVIVCIIGVQMGIAAVKTLWIGVEAPPKNYAIIVIIFSIVVKEILFRYNLRLGKLLSSHALVANAWEHRSDVYASLAVLIGVVGAIIGNSIGWPWAYYLDPIAGLFVSFIVLLMGYRLAMEAIHNTMDHVLHNEDSADFITTVQQVTGVMTIDNLRAREHGYYVIIDLKISVNPRISVFEGHHIAKLVKLQLKKRFPYVLDVFIHVNPYDPGFADKNQANRESELYPTIIH